MLRVVVDTGIIVRAIIKPQGTVGPVLKRLRDGEYVLLYTEPLLEELVDVLNRPRIRTKYHVEGEDIEAVVRLILLRGEAVHVSRRISVCRDPKDDKILEAAVAGQADVIVSGDEDLLILKEFEGVPIVTPSTFLQRYM